MKVRVDVFRPGFELGAFEVWFTAFEDDGATPLRTPDGVDVFNNDALSIIVFVPLNASNEVPSGAELDTAILLEVSRFARRRLLPASNVTAGKIPGIVDLASEPAADAPP